MPMAFTTYQRFVVLLVTIAMGTMLVFSKWDIPGPFPRQHPYIPLYYQLMDKVIPLTEEQIEEYRHSYLMLLWTTRFSSIAEDDVLECHLDKKCIVTSRREWTNQSLAIVFHGRDVDKRDMPQRNKYQKWVIWAVESPSNEPIMHDIERLRLFDYSLTYRMDSDFPAPYIGESTISKLNATMEPVAKRRKVPIAWVANNCDTPNGREYYIKELMKHIQVDSYGKCLHNKDFDSESEKQNIGPLIRQYKFYLTFENSNCKDYFTEKLKRCYELGIVPIVNGPRSMYANISPNNHSLIFVDEYESPKELAQYISFLHENDKEYMRYLSYRTGEISPTFLKTINITHPFCKLCDAMSKAHPEQSEVQGHSVVLPDYSCGPNYQYKKYYIEDQ